MEQLELELGDIIKVKSPSNTILHDHTLFVSYIDNQSYTRFIDTENVQSYTIEMKDGKYDTAAGIEQIILLSRSTERGFARQNGLVIGTWVDIHMTGDIPMILTACVTHLEEDMIELTRYVPDGDPSDKMYIDFAYKGIPDDYPITEICIRDAPLALQKKDGDETPEESVSDEDESQYSITFHEDGNIEIVVPENARADEGWKDKLYRLQQEGYEKSKQPNQNTRQEENTVATQEEVEEEDDEDSFYNAVYTPKHLQLYKIDAQLNDLYSDFLSRIPDKHRTNRVMKQITTHIQRFEELREEYSVFDETHKIQRTPQKNHETYRPLANSLLYDCTGKYSWIRPVASHKHVINIEEKLREKLNPIPNTDVVIYDTGTTLKGENNIRNQLFYQRLSRENAHLSYENMWKETKPYMTPYEQFPSNRVGIYRTMPLKINSDNDIVIANMSKFRSTVFSSATETVATDVSVYSTSACVVQRYQSPVKYYPEIRKKTREERTLMTGDTANVHGFLFYPFSLMTHYSRMFLPSTNLLQRSSILTDSRYPYNDYLLEDSTNRIVTFEGDANYPLYPKDKKIQYLSLYPSQTNSDINNLQQTNESDIVQSRVNSMLPNAFALIDKYSSLCKHFYNLHAFLQFFEPFGLYTNTITSNVMGKIFRVIKQNNREYQSNYNSIKNQFQNMRAEKYELKKIRYLNQQLSTSVFKDILNENSNLQNIFKTTYLMIDDKNTASTILHKAYVLEDGKLLALMMRHLNTELTNSEDFFKNIDLHTNIEDTNAENHIFNSVEANDCYRKNLTKEYRSVRDLESDNNKTNIVYDTKYDNTNYSILEKYKDTTTTHKKTNEEFLGFLSEQLVRTHHCPTRLAREMAETLVRGTRYVQNGEFAKLIVTPSLPSTVDEDSLSSKEKSDIEIEKDARKKESFFVRKNDVWILDKDVDETSFTHTKTLFCNLQDKCYKKEDGTDCEDIELDTKSRMLRDAKRRMTEELHGRYEHSLQEEKEILEDAIVRLRERILTMKEMAMIKQHAFSQRAYDMGKQLVKNERIISPHWGIRSFIFHSSVSFDERQNALIEFYQLYCREPLEEVDNIGWKYCRETNTPLLESCLYDLACAYLNGEYMKKMQIIVKRQGKLSDDGGSIIDQFTGCVLKNLEFSEDGGFLQTLEDIDERDTNDMDNDMDNTIAISGKNSQKVKTKANTIMYENDDFQNMYELLCGLCSKTYVPVESIETNAMRICTDLFGETIMSQKKYKALLEKRKDKAAKMVSYPVYKATSKVKIVSAAFVVSVQCLTPSFKTTKYERTCDKNFSGYPLEITDTSNQGLIKYISCIVRLLNKGNSDVSISQKPGAFEKVVFDFIKDTVLSKEYAQNLLETKRDYLQENETSDNVPTEMDVPVQWQRFSPPIYSIDIMGKTNMTFVTRAFYEKLESDFKVASENQWAGISIFTGKIELFAYGIVHMLENILHKKPTVLNTMSQIPYQQNACCNEPNQRKMTTLEYFSQEDERISTFIKSTNVGTRHLLNFKKMVKAPFLHFSKTNENKTNAVIPSTNTVNYYRTLDKFTMAELFFHHTKYDSRAYVLPEDLRAICPERPVNYNPDASLEQKIEFMEEQGKQLKSNLFVQLMGAINRRNMVTVSHRVRYDWKAQIIAELNQFNENVESHFETNYPINGGIDIRNPSQYLLNYLQNSISESNSTSSTDTETLINDLSAYNRDVQKSLKQFLDKYAPPTEKKKKKKRGELVGEFFSLMFPEETTYTVEFMERFVVQYMTYIGILFPLYIGTNQRTSILCKDTSGLLDSDITKMNEYAKHAYEELYKMNGNRGYTPQLSIVSNEVMEIAKPLHTIIPLISQISTNPELICTVYKCFVLIIFHAYMDSSISHTVVRQTRALMTELENNQNADDIVEEFMDDNIHGNYLDTNSRQIAPFLGESLYSYLKYGYSPEKQIHLKSYEDIVSIVDRSKEIEKNKVKRYYASLRGNGNGEDVLKAEMKLKLLRLGKYNVNQSDLIRYGKKVQNFFDDNEETSDDLNQITDAVQELEAEYEVDDAEDLFGGMNSDDEDGELAEDALLAAEEENEYGEDDDANDIYEYGS